MPVYRPLAERFWEKVHKTDGCWLWTAATKIDGYGIIGVNGKPLTAHRVVWGLMRGPIPDGMEVCHSCDNPPCVNPDHLFLGTHAENMADMARKKRLINVREQRGEKNASAKLTALEVGMIRELVNGGLQQKKVAERFDVSRATVCMIMKGRRWVSL